MADAQLARGEHDRRETAGAAVASGELRKLADGRAAYYTGLNAAASGDRINYKTDGQVVIPKNSSGGITFTDGDLVFWDDSNAQAREKMLNTTSDFLVGCAVGNAANTDSTMTVNLNAFENKLANIFPGATTVAATGANIATANSLAYGFNVVTGANSSAGVQLPIPKFPGQVVKIKSWAAAGNLGVYPHTGGGINSGAANANTLMGSNNLNEFIAINTQNWATAANCLTGGL